MVADARGQARCLKASAGAVIDWLGKSGADLSAILDQRGAFVLRGFEQIAQPEHYDGSRGRRALSS